MILNSARWRPYDRLGDDCPICGRRHRGEIDGAARLPARILIAEDEPNVCALIAYNLELDGYSVDCVEDGETALRALREDPPDLLVLDLLLPLRSGWQVLRAIRADADARVRELPVLVVSALACDRLSRQLAGHGAEDVLGKPFSIAELKQRVGEAVSGSRRTAQCEEPSSFIDSPRAANPRLTRVR